MDTSVSKSEHEIKRRIGEATAALSVDEVLVSCWFY